MTNKPNASSDCTLLKRAHNRVHWLALPFKEIAILLAFVAIMSISCTAKLPLSKLLTATPGGQFFGPTATPSQTVESKQGGQFFGPEDFGTPGPGAAALTSKKDTATPRAEVTSTPKRKPTSTPKTKVTSTPK